VRQGREFNAYAILRSEALRVGGEGVLGSVVAMGRAVVVHFLSWTIFYFIRTNGKAFSALDQPESGPRRKGFV
jgi:hypothetical protein